MTSNCSVDHEIQNLFSCFTAVQVSRGNLGPTPLVHFAQLTRGRSSKLTCQMHVWHSTLLKFDDKHLELDGTKNLTTAQIFEKFRHLNFENSVTQTGRIYRWQFAPGAS